MTALQDLKENTYLPGRHFPMNVFHNHSRGDRVLYLHWHEHLEILYVVKGNAVFDIGGCSYRTSPGDLLFVHSGELHSGYAINNSDVDYYAVVLGKALFGGDASDPFFGPMILPFMEGRRRFPACLSDADEGYAAFAEPVKRMIAEFEGKLPGFELSIRAQLQLLLSEAIRRTEAEAPAAPRVDSLRSELFEPLFALVRQEYARPIGLKEAAGLVNMSVYHFCKMFKRLTGRTFVEYVNLYRVNEAERLLMTTDINVTEAADRVGFGSINYFIRTFKTFKHYSPSHCKKAASRRDETLR